MTTNVRTTYPPGIPCWPVLRSGSPEEAAAFCAELLGWRIEIGGPWHGLARLDGRAVAGFDVVSAGDEGEGWSTFVATDDIGRAAERVVAAGGRIVDGPSTTAGGDRFATGIDPGGVPFGLWEGHDLAGAELVNAPGSWNWSDLESDDPDGAARFYGSVFGWATRSIDFGGAEATMWYVDGYGDHLATLDPDLRARHAEPGVPEGFSDAVGWLQPLSGERARWVVTFTVDDPDAVAAHAEALGGRVVFPPSTMGPVRLAAVAGPGGAAFTVSRYQPDGGPAA